MNPINHVAIIMDGNGRWGLNHNGSRNSGHRAGLTTVEKILKESIRNKIKHLTLYTFSTENWKRPKKEVDFLFNLLENFLSKRIGKLVNNGIKLKIIGDKKLFSQKLRNILKKSELKTSYNQKIQVNVALNYGSKSEIVNAIKQIKKKKRINHRKKH